MFLRCWHLANRKSGRRSERDQKMTHRRPVTACDSADTSLPGPPPTTGSFSTSTPLPSPTPAQGTLDMSAAWGQVTVHRLPSAMGNNQVFVFENAATPDGQWLVGALEPRDFITNTTRPSFAVLYNISTRQIVTMHHRPGSAASRSAELYHTGGHKRGLHRCESPYALSIRGYDPEYDQSAGAASVG